ncbi:MAG TPA: hypothetical protein VK983_01735 [Candidatus Limnocylindrales bacterium]|nr:hypothetical protein [Candidatus Limnocylindrales bacterium]
MDKEAQKIVQAAAGKKSALPYVGISAAIVAAISGFVARQLVPTPADTSPQLLGMGMSILILIFITLPAILVAIGAAIGSLIVGLRQGK